PSSPRKRRPIRRVACCLVVEANNRANQPRSLFVRPPSQDREDTAHGSPPSRGRPEEGLLHPLRITPVHAVAALNLNNRIALPPRIAFFAASERNGRSQIVAGTSKSCAGKFEPHTNCVSALIARNATSSAAGSSGRSSGCEL